MGRYQWIGSKRARMRGKHVGQKKHSKKTGNRLLYVWIAL
jgi:hypothetical protein